MPVDRITFIASLPPIGSAISVHGEGGMRIKLDIPESELAGALRLLTLRGHSFQVTMLLAPPLVVSERGTTWD